jgi:hypothetical protein
MRMQLRCANNDGSEAMMTVLILMGAALILCCGTSLFFMGALMQPGVPAHRYAGTCMALGVTVFIAGAMVLGGTLEQCL